MIKLLPQKLQLCFEIYFVLLISVLEDSKDWLEAEVKHFEDWLDETDSVDWFEEKDALEFHTSTGGRSSCLVQYQVLSPGLHFSKRISSIPNLILVLN